MLKHRAALLLALAFCLFVPAYMVGCSAGAELQMEKSSLIAQHAASDNDKERAILEARIKAIDDATALAEKQSDEDAATARDAAIATGIAAPFAGLVFAGVKWASKNRILSNLVNAIEEAKSKDPELAQRWAMNEDTIRSRAGSEASAVVRKIKSKRKATKA